MCRSTQSSTTRSGRASDASERRSGHKGPRDDCGSFKPLRLDGYGALRLGLAIGVLAFFWPAYVGGALTFLFGDLFLTIRRHARELGLAFAAALLVHLGLVVRLCAIGSPPSPETFAIFGVAAGFVYLLTGLSVDRLRQALPRESWPILRTVAMTYIAFASSWTLRGSL